MGKLIGFELKKIRHTFIQALLLASLAGPIALMLVMYAAGGEKTFFEVAVSSSVFMQMIPFTLAVIIGCFIVAREYKENMMLYLKITPQSQVKIILSKMIIIAAAVFITQILTFISLLVMNIAIDGYDTDLLQKYIEAGLISAGTLSCLVPAIVFISLLRRSISGSSLILLVIFMMTFPFVFSADGYIFPHLLPMILVAKFYGNSVYDNISFLSGTLILTAAAAIFVYLSVRLAKKKDK